MLTIRVPFQFDSRGGIAQVTSTRDIVMQQITDFLVTAQYERVMNPTYGADVPRFLFSPMASSLMNAKAEEVRTALNRVVQLADIVDVTMTPLRGSDNAVSLDVRFVITPSPTVFSLTRTITGLVTSETAFGEIV